MATDTNSIIFNQRHPELSDKDENWKLIYDAYRGGLQFKNGKYLIQYPKESNGSFATRKQRAVYFNQMSPVVDMLSGSLFLNDPVRNIPKELNYLLNKVSGKKKLNEFMRIVAAHSFMFTCGVLVDSPDFNPEIVRTRKDRMENGINPYAILYLPFKIRDFNINANDGELDWVILDNSYWDHPDPFSAGKDVIKYTLWTREYCQHFIQEDKKSILAREKRPHNVGYVPFHFISWRDDNNDFIGETVCEDIAMICKLIYNNMSYMDEMLASGTFKMLVYPTKDGRAPDELIDGGIGSLSLLPVDIEARFAPEFIGAQLAEVDPFIKAINFYMTEILKKVGLSTDEMKEFVKSGIAKEIDLQKMQALLQTGALMMGRAEEWIFRTAARWENRNIKTNDIKSEYTAKFSAKDLQTEITMLDNLLLHPIRKLQQETLKLQIKKLLANDLTPDILQLIYNEVDKSNLSEKPVDVNVAAQKIKENQNNNTQE
jgi:hypothetical protein